MNTKMIAIVCVCVGFISGYTLRSIFIPTKSFDKISERKRVAEQGRWQQKADQWDSASKAFQQQQILVGHQLTASKQQLATQKQKQKTVEQRTRWLAAKGKALKGTSAAMTNCDSLATAVILLADGNRYTDSLYNDLVSALELQVATKDSMIDNAQHYIRELEVASSDCFALQRGLMEDNERLKKQVLKEKRKHKLISAVVFIASGAAIYGLLR